MGGDAREREAGLFRAPVELEREHQIRELRLAVGAPDAVAAPLEREIVEVETAEAVREARDADDASAWACTERRHHEPREGRVPEMIDAEVPLEAVLRRPPRGQRDARIVDEEIETIAGELTRTCRRLPHRPEVGEIELEDIDLALRGATDPLDRGAAALGIATGDPDARPRLGQHGRRAEAETRVRAGDERGATGLIGDIHAAAQCHGAASDGNRYLIAPS